MPASQPDPTHDEQDEVVLAIGGDDDGDGSGDDEISPQGFATMVEGGVAGKLWSHDQAMRMILGHWKQYRVRHPDAGAPPVLRR